MFPLLTADRERAKGVTFRIEGCSSVERVRVRTTRSRGHIVDMKARNLSDSNGTKRIQTERGRARNSLGFLKISVQGCDMPRVF